MPRQKLRESIFSDMALGMQLSGMKGNLIIINYGSESLSLISVFLFFLAVKFIKYTLVGKQSFWSGVWSYVVLHNLVEVSVSDCLKVLDSCGTESN